MRTFFVLLLALPMLSGSVRAHHSLSARVVTGTGTPRRAVPHAAVALAGQERGTYADEQGRFTLDGLRPGDSLRVSSVGYRTQIVRVADLGTPPEIRLEEVPVALAEVPIRREKGTLRRVGSQRSEGPSAFYVSSEGKSEVALLLPGASDSTVTYLTSVGFFVGEGQKPKAPFRVRIYSVKNRQPGDDLLLHSLVTAARRGGWHDVVVWKFNLRVPPEGLFVSMEWLYGAQKKFFTYNTFYPHYPDRSGARPRVNYGQNLGMSSEFGMFRTYVHSFGRDWKRSEPSPNLFKIENGNAMIRAEYLVYD